MIQVGETQNFMTSMTVWAFIFIQKRNPHSAYISKKSAAICPRARDMHVARVYENVNHKTDILEDIIKRYGVSPDEMCFVGDDIVDLCLMRKVGLPVAVANACEEVKASAVWVTSIPGGRGAVRQVCEIILKAQGKWDLAIRAYEV